MHCLQTNTQNITEPRKCSLVTFYLDGRNAWLRTNLPSIVTNHCKSLLPSLLVLLLCDCPCLTRNIEGRTCCWLGRSSTRPVEAKDISLPFSCKAWSKETAVTAEKAFCDRDHPLQASRFRNENGRAAATAWLVSFAMMRSNRTRQQDTVFVMG